MTTVCGVGSHSHSDRGHDFYATPREATESLLAIEDKWLPHKGAVIGEPAIGDGAISRVLLNAGYPVLGMDVVDRGVRDTLIGDYLTGPNYSFDAIVTNPPYKLAREFVDKALTQAPYVAMLLRLAFLEGMARKPWFEAAPLARVHVSSRRLPMMHRDGWEGPKSSSAVCHAWFVWDKRHEGAPVIKWFDWKQHAAPTAANDNAPAETFAAAA
jgi:hypothetical protein